MVEINGIMCPDRKKTLAMVAMAWKLGAYQTNDKQYKLY